MSKKRRLIKVPEPKNHKKIVLWVVLGVVLAAVLTLGLLGAFRPDLLRAKKTITVEIHHSDRYVEELKISTRMRYLDEMLIEEDLVTLEDGRIVAAGREGKEKINTQYVYWAVYDGDTLIETDISELPIEAGKTYKIVFTSK